MSARRALAIGLGVVLLGSVLAHVVQTAGGTVRVTDVRFVDARGSAMSGLLYVPHEASAAHPAPAILAVHGYINSRETQSPFAIELSRRGFVVLALDQTGHGFSAPPAFAAGFGGPAGLEYLRALPFVDRDNVGLEGHSMGGWAVLSAAAAEPDGYRALVLEGSTTGVLGAPEGSPAFPRNLAIVFSRFDEFSDLMWGVPRGRDVAASKKLQAVFGSTDEIVEGRIYGDERNDLARVLRVPVTTHPGDHFSDAAVLDAIEWFQRWLAGSHPAAGQIWLWKEIGTLLGFLGLVVVIPAAAIALLEHPFFARIAAPAVREAPRLAAAWPLAVVPALTYFPLFLLSDRLIAPNPFWPQQITNGLMLWLVGNGALTAALLAWRGGLAQTVAGVGDGRFERITKALLLAVLAVAAGYALLAIVASLMTVDFRFWVVAVKPLAPWHVVPFFAYLPVLTVFFVLLGAALAPYTGGPSHVRAAARAAAILSGGFMLLLAVQYVPLLLGATLPLGQPLLTIVAIQFVVLLAVVGVNAAVCQRATGAIHLGAFVNALFVDWVVVAGQATHAA